jgi:uncharacterized repeat protein (TIGR03803 family)
LFVKQEAQFSRSASRKVLAATRAALAIVLLTVMASAWQARAQNFIVLHTFANTPDGAYPVAPVLRDAAGTLYGTTFFGGTESAGTVFKVDKDDTETVLFSFSGTEGQPSGAFPSGNLVTDEDGNLYGTALEGSGGSGVVYKLTPSGKETILHNFEGGIGTTDPKVPESGLLLDKVGNLYGTTICGGASKSCYTGTVFKLAKNGKLTVLHSFTGGSDGGAPMASLIMDEVGNLYGTTFVGGDLECTLQGEKGCGVVFKLDRFGKETVLHAFTGKDDGAFPLGGGVALVADADGNFYGAAGYAGAFGGQCGIYGCGTVFKLDKTGKFTVLHAFSKDGTEGETPNGALVLDPAGNLYGTTQTGGAAGNYGTVFEVSRTGKLTVLYSLNGGSEGATPFAGLIRDSQGNLYGTAYQAFLRFERVGTVFKVTP